MIFPARFLLCNQRGSTLIEYTLIGSLIALVSIAGVFALGNNLKSTLTGLKADIGMGRVTIVPVTVAEAATVQPSSSPVPTVAEAPSPVPASVTSANGNLMQNVCLDQGGLCVDIPVVIPNSTISATSGALGGQLTHDFASVFEQLAVQLDAQGNPDPTVRDLITHLANSGHTIASNQEKLLGTCAPGVACSSSRTLDTAAYQSGGLGQTPAQVYLAGITQSSDNFKSSLTTLQDYLSAHPDVISAEAQEIISLESQQIVNIANAYPPADVVSVKTSSSVHHSGEETRTSSTTTWTVSVNAVLVTQNANTICKNGGNTTKCIKTP